MAAISLVHVKILKILHLLQGLENLVNLIEKYTSTMECGFRKSLLYVRLPSGISCQIKSLFKMAGKRLFLALASSSRKITV